MITRRSRNGYNGSLRYAARFTGNSNTPKPCRSCMGPKDNAPGSPYCATCRTARAGARSTHRKGRTAAMRAAVTPSDATPTEWTLPLVLRWLWEQQHA